MEVRVVGWTLALVLWPAHSAELARAPGMHSLTFLCTEPLAADTLAQVRAQMQQAGISVPDSLPDDFDALRGPIGMIQPLEDGFEGPEPDYLRYKGRSLDAADVDALQGEQQGFRMALFVPTPNQDAVVRRVGSLARDVARGCGAYLWDGNTREVFTASSWTAARIDAVDADPMLGVMDHVVLHSYQEGDLMRVVSLGMDKLGLPDLVIEPVPRGMTGGASKLLNLTAQTLLEQGGLTGLEVSLDVATLHHEATRTVLSAEWDTGATGAVDIVFGKAKRRDGDPDNGLMRIDFPAMPGDTPMERLDGGLSQLFGSSDSIQRVDHDDQLLALREQAHLRLVTSVKERYRAGLPLGTQFLVKGPFETSSGGTEWMWVEVTRWRGRKIVGVLANDPFEVPELRAGARVKLKVADLFDYLLVFADGTREGNTTGEYMLQLQGRGE